MMTPRLAAYARGSNARTSVPILSAAGVDRSTMAVTAASPPPARTPKAIGRIDCDTTSITTSRGVAPSAIRTPISVRRCSTR
jgi:hypothetical protein